MGKLKVFKVNRKFVAVVSTLNLNIIRVSPNMLCGKIWITLPNTKILHVPLKASIPI